MSTHPVLIVDGYNVIRRSTALAQTERHSLQHGRDTLIAQLAARYGQRAHAIMIVFDGDSMAETRTARHGMTIIYTAASMTADACIVALAQEMQARGQTVTVATDDQAIRAALGGLQPDVQPLSATGMSEQLLAAPPLLSKQYRHRTAVKRFLADRDDPDRTPRQNQRGNPRRTPRKRG